MRKILMIGIFVCLVLLGVDYAFLISPKITRADDETPTETWEPLFKTSTPRPTDNWSCPNGTPVNWGTVTPGIWWDVNCRNCLLTLTPPYTATPTPEGWISPTPTSLPNTATPYPFDSYELQCITANINQVLTDCTANRGRDLMLYFDGSCHSGSCGLEPIIIVTVNFVCRQGYTCNDNWFTLNLNYEIHAIGAWVADSTAYQLSVNTNSHFYNSSPDVYHTRNCGVTENCVFDDQYSGFRSVLINRNKEAYRFTINFNSPQHPGTYAENVWLHLAAGEFNPTATPLPTFTPEPGNCNEVTTDEGTIMDTTLPIIRLGPPNCAGSIPEFDVDFSSIPLLGDILGDVHFPGFAMCFRGIDLGEIHVIGVHVDLDYFALIMAAVLLYRTVRV
jgi:hypothetical protein